IWTACATVSCAACAALLWTSRLTMPANRLFFAPLTRLSLALLLGALAGCAVGPDYQRPDAPVGEHFREARVEGAWKTAQPADLQARGAWWAAFNDGVLDELMRGLNTQNFSVQQ